MNKEIVFEDSHCDFCGKTKEKVVSTCHGVFCAECIQILLIALQEGLDELEEVDE